MFDRKAYQQRYYTKNKDKINARVRAYRAANPDKMKQWAINYINKNKEICGKRKREWLATLRGNLGRKIQHLKKAKRARILEVAIDIDFLEHLWEKQGGKCAISGYPMRYPECSLFSLSVDRINPDGGYTKNNVQLVCQGINFGKNKYTNQEMIEFWEYRNFLPGDSYGKYEESLATYCYQI